MVGIDGEEMTFGAAVELAVAMPLSRLPLISDYTRDAEKPTQATRPACWSTRGASCRCTSSAWARPFFYRRV